MRGDGPERARGRFFIRFLMILVFIRRKLRKYSESLTPKQRKDDKVHNMNVKEVLRLLNTVLAIGSTGEWKLTHFTKTNRQLFSALGLKSVNSGKVVLGHLDQVCEPLAPEAQEFGSEQ